MSNLTFYERQKIEYYLRLRMSKREIARRLKRDHSVILRELKRNKSDYFPYSAKLAQQLADRRGSKTNKRKLDEDPVLKRYVKSGLKEGLSPEEISGRLKNHPPPDMRGKTISHESIYQYIYEGNGKYLYKYLRKKNAPKRQKQCNRKKHEDLSLTERISINQRPGIIDERMRIGDWESDSVKFGRQKAGLSVQCERKSLTLRIHKVEDLTSYETERALEESIGSLPQYLWQTITFDNGKENVCHKKIRDDYVIDTYFCDPYCSWQKGSVENSIGLIREYLPRGTDMSTITDRDIYKIQEKLNNRPRKKLNYLTPNEVIQQEINPQGGALNS